MKDQGPRGVRRHMRTHSSGCGIHASGIGYGICRYMHAHAHAHAHVGL